MQNYNQPGYERPGSTMSFTGQPPPDPQYQQQQWGQPPPPLSQQQQQQQQQQTPAASGYNPGTYGAMPGGYTQGSQQYPPSTQPYAPQPHSDVPPPPPPKPYGFAAAVQKQSEQNPQHVQYAQSTQSWQQPQQSDTSFTPQAQQGGYPGYNNAAPPPPSTTIAGSYFNPSQGGRPGSIYGADHVGSTSSSVPQRPASTIMSPNEQAPAYIPPSLSGQGVQAYMPSNTNPMPGVYVPPPPDVPAWQQAQHAPLQSGNKRFTYTKPTVDPSFYAQGYEGTQATQQQPPPLPPRFDQTNQQAHLLYGQQPPQYPSQNHTSQYDQNQQQPTPTYGQPGVQQQAATQPPAHFGQLGEPVQPLQQQYTQPPVPQTYIQQQAAQLEQYSQSHQQQQMQQQTQSPAQQQNQWQAPAPVQSNYAQQHHDHGESATGYQPQQQHQQWPSLQQPQPAAGQSYYSRPGQTIPEPKPLNGTDTAPSDFVQHHSSQPHVVSPIVSQHASSFAPNHPVSARTDSVSSIALANLHSQRVETRTASPKPPSFKNLTPPPPRDDAARFSALGTGGPSDWENFGMGDEVDDEALFARKPRPVQLDSVELPAHQPSPPSTQGWPSPANPHVYSQNSDHQDTYQPTPPTAKVSPVYRIPSPNMPQQDSFAKHALAAPLRASPKPLQRHEAPQDARHGFVMGEVIWSEPNSPNRTSNAQQQANLEGPALGADRPQGVQVPASVQAPSIETPSSNMVASSAETPQQQRPGTTRFFSDVGSTFGLSTKDRDPSQSRDSKEASNLQLELQAKDEELWRLRKESKDEVRRVQADIEAGKAEFLAEIERLKTDGEAARALVHKQNDQLSQQAEAMKTAAEQAKLDADAVKKENDLTIERIKEDIEGKEDTIKDRDSTIVALQKELDDLRKQLDEERSKVAPEPPKPTALDLIPDLDPWYAGSLERYITMLRGEANESQVEDKIKTFKAFVTTESGIRGIEFHDAVPVPAAEHAIPGQAFQSAEAQGNSGVHSPKRNLKVVVPQESPNDDDYEYSPGGRPLIKRSTFPAAEIAPPQAPLVLSSQSTAILTPASSVHDDSTPIQSPPDEQAQPQYKAYVPPIMSTDAASTLAQRTVTGPSVRPNMNLSVGSGGSQDEIFFDARGSGNNRIGHQASSSDDSGGVPVVAPLNLAHNRPVSISIQPKGDALNSLNNLLPAKFEPARSSPMIDELRREAIAISSASKDVDELTKAWEKSASLTRRKNADARRKRAEESEAHNDDLFNSDELSYAELKDLEVELKERENKLKIQEDQEECKDYVETVFEKVYHDLQGDIAALIDLYIKAETLLHTSVSGVKSFEGGDAPTTKVCLELLLDIHGQTEKIHDEVVKSVAERDKRYKKSEVQALYLAGNIAKMKVIEKHFEHAEKQALQRAKNEKAKRLSDLVKVVEEAVVGAATIEQNERCRIVAAIRDLKEGDVSTDILRRASETLDGLHESSKTLLTLFNRLEISLNTAEVEADIAHARADGEPEPKVQELQSEMKARETELNDEFTRRIGVLDQDRKEVEQLTKPRSGSVGTSDENEKEKRLKAALEEAKRRNGHA